MERKKHHRSICMGAKSRRVKASDPFTEPYLRELHRRMFNRTWKWLVLIATRRKTLESSWHEIRNRIPALLGNTRYWVDHQDLPRRRDSNSFPSRVGWRYPPIPERKRKTCSPSRRCHRNETRKAEFTWGQNSIVGTGPTREAYIRALQAADHG